MRRYGWTPIEIARAYRDEHPDWSPHVVAQASRQLHQELKKMKDRERYSNIKFYANAIPCEFVGEDGFFAWNERTNQEFRLAREDWDGTQRHTA